MGRNKENRYLLTKIIVKHYVDKKTGKPGYYLNDSIENRKKVSEAHLEKMFNQYCIFVQFAKCTYDFDEPGYFLVYCEKDDLKYIVDRKDKSEAYVRLYSMHDINLLKHFIDFV